MSILHDGKKKKLEKISAVEIIFSTFFNKITSYVFKFVVSFKYFSSVLLKVISSAHLILVWNWKQLKNKKLITDWASSVFSPASCFRKTKTKTPNHSEEGMSGDLFQKIINNNKKSLRDWLRENSTNVFWQATLWLLMHIPLLCHRFLS